MAIGDLLRNPLIAGAQRGLPTAPASPQEDSNEDRHQSLASITHELLKVSILGSRQKDVTLSYPTPPRSSVASASSSTQTDVEVGSDTAQAESGRQSSGTERRPVRRNLSADNGASLRVHRQKTGLDPLSTVTSSPSVSASHISNPTKFRSSAPNTPIRASQALSAESSLISHLENTKLTDDAAPPRKKNTPPHTPRALSNDGADSARRSVATSTPRNSQSPARDGTGRTHQGSAPVGPPKGKLTVSIPRARGLRPSYYPYAVCVFEWNESIARGEKLESIEMERDDSRGREDPSLTLPIKRSGSEMGRSMAIPMKSRQSSTTSLSDQKTFKSGRQVTDPKWDHEAILFVIPWHHSYYANNMSVMYLASNRVSTCLSTIAATKRSSATPELTSM